MSRYEWRNEKGKDVSIGWDKPMGTFFLQIHNPKAKRDRDYCELWLGGEFREFESLETLLEKAKINIPDELQTHLLHDRYGLSDWETLPVLPDNISRRF